MRKCGWERKRCGEQGGRGKRSIEARWAGVCFKQMLKHPLPSGGCTVPCRDAALRHARRGGTVIFRGRSADALFLGAQICGTATSRCAKPRQAGRNPGKAPPGHDLVHLRLAMRRPGPSGIRPACFASLLLPSSEHLYPTRQYATFLSPMVDITRAPLIPKSCYSHNSQLTTLLDITATCVQGSPAPCSDRGSDPP